MKLNSIPDLILSTDRFIIRGIVSRKLSNSPATVLRHKGGPARRLLPWHSSSQKSNAISTSP